MGKNEKKNLIIQKKCIKNTYGLYCGSWIQAVQGSRIKWFDLFAGVVPVTIKYK